MQLALGLCLELSLRVNVRSEQHNNPAAALLTQGQGHADEPQPAGRSALTVQALTPSQREIAPADPSSSLSSSFVLVSSS